MACGSLEALVDCRFVPTVVAATVLVALAAWFLYLNFTDRVHRAFALLFLLYAGMIGLVAFSSAAYDLAGRLRGYFIIAVPFAAAHFAVTYRDRYARGAVRRGRRWRAARTMIILGAALAAEAAYIYDHSLFYDCAAGFCYDGPLALFFPIAFASLAGVGLLMTIEYVACNPQGCKRAFYVAAVAFSLTPLNASGWLGTWAAINGFSIGSGRPLNVVDDFLWLVPGLVALAQLLVLARHAVKSEYPSANVDAARAAIVFAIPFGAGVVLALIGSGAGAATYFNVVMTNFIVAALFTVTLPVLIAYALLRHRLFELDVRIQRAISRTTVAATFVAVFFIVSEWTAYYLSGGSTSPASVFFGIVAAGLLLFALHPIYSWAERVASAAMPGVKAFGQMTQDERLAVFREQVELAWLDGQLDPKERLLLDRLRARLGIPAEQAARLESEAVEKIVGTPASASAAPVATGKR